MRTVGLALVLAVLPGCPAVAPPPADVDAGSANCTVADGDADGFAALACGGLDCDDRDPDVHPGAADEVGDGVDQSCDGVDGVDQDGDGEASVESGGGDCDDGRGSVGPRAAEAQGFVRDRIWAPDVPFSPSIAVDAGDRVHLVWATGGARGAWHASDEAGPWIIEQALDVGAVYTAATVAGDTMHVLATDTVVQDSAWVADDIWHASRAAGQTQWVVEELVHAPLYEFAGFGLSAASGADGTLYAAHQQYLADGSAELRVEIVPPDGLRRSELVDRGPANGVTTGIAVGPDGALHVTWDWCPNNNCEIRYATNGTGSWVAQTVSEPDHSCRSPSVSLSAEGEPWIAFGDQTVEALRMARHTPQGWDREDVDGGHPHVINVHLSVSSQAGSHVVYFVATEDFNSTEVRYATDAGGTWRILPVSETAASSEPVLADDHSGRPIIGYTRASRSDVVVARTDGIDSDCDGQDL